MKLKISIAAIALLITLWLLSDGWKNYISDKKKTSYVNTSELDNNHFKDKRTPITLIPQRELIAGLVEKNIPVKLEQLLTNLHAEDDAGPLLMKIIETFKRDKQISELVSKYHSDFNKLTDEGKDKVRQFFERDDISDILNLLEEASGKAAANFNIDYSKGAAVELPQLGHFRSITKLLSLKSKIEAEDGNLESAVNSINLGLKVNDVASDSMLVINELVKNASMNILLTSLQDLKTVAAKNKITYDILEKQLLQMTDNQIKSIDGERLVFGSYFEKLMDDPEKMMREVSDVELKGVTPEIMKVDFQMYLNYMIKYREFLDSPDANADTKLKELADYATENKHEYPLTSILLPSISGIYGRYQEQKSRVKLNLISLKLEEYKQKNGSYPKTLKPLYLPDDILIESLTGKPFNYENGKLKANYEYRKGKNLELVIQESEE